MCCLFFPVGFKGNLSLLEIHFFPGDLSKWKLLTGPVIQFREDTGGAIPFSQPMFSQNQGQPSVPVISGCGTKTVVRGSTIKVATFPQQVPLTLRGATIPGTLAHPQVIRLLRKRTVGTKRDKVFPWPMNGKWRLIQFNDIAFVGIA